MGSQEILFIIIITRDFGKEKPAKSLQGQVSGGQCGYKLNELWCTYVQGGEATETSLGGGYVVCSTVDDEVKIPTTDSKATCSVCKSARINQRNSCRLGSLYV